jgi:GxxExxY protein
VSNASFPESDYPHQELTDQIIGAGYTVDRAFGFGFLERVYRRALVIELGHCGIAARTEVPFRLEYRGTPIGLYRADLVVDSKVIVEVKTGLLLDPAATPQMLNYLRASGLAVGLVLYFGPRMKIKRLVNSRTLRSRPAT